MPYSRLRLTALLGLLFAVGLATGAARPPNLLIILTDDQGHHDVGFNGCTDIPTPHLDSIAHNGVRFSAGYVAYAVCSPSRAALLTGRYGQRFGYERNPRFQPLNPQSGLARGETTLADTLKAVGYRTGVIGKWHLGAHPDFHPLKRGFDEFFGHLGGGHRYFPEELTIKEPDRPTSEAESYRTWIQRDHTPVQTAQYLTDEFSAEAVKFIGRHQATPFFLYLAYNAPHSPLQATESYLKRFQHIKDVRRRTYAAMVSAVDDGVGRILTELRARGLEKDTLIFFLSDNGGPTADNGSENTPLRAGKGSPWEGGIRVPFAAQWLGHIPAGLTYDRPVISMDIFATIAALANAPRSSARPLDGVNLLPYLTGEKTGDPHEALYLRMFDKGAFVVRDGQYKMVIPQTGAPTELYDLTADIAEKRNLAAERPDVVRRLELLRSTWNQQLIEPVFEGLLTDRKKK